MGTVDPNPAPTLRTASYRSLLPGIITAVLFILTLFLLVIPFHHRSMINARKENLRHLTEMAWSLLDRYAAEAAAGRLSSVEARRLALEDLKGVRYGPEMKDYFWIIDMKAHMILHPYRSDLNGRDVAGFTDPDGNRLFSQMVAVVRRQKAGFVDYRWQWKDDPHRIVSKISYVKGFAPWGWIVGTGLYTEDVKAAVATMVQRLALVCALIILVVVVLSAVNIAQLIHYERQRQKDDARREDRIRLLSLEAELGRILTRREDLAILLKESAELLAQRIATAGAGIWLFDPEKGALAPGACAGGRGPEIFGEEAGLQARGILQRLADARQPVFGDADDPSLAPLFQAIPEADPSPVFVGHPLLVEDRLVGVMAFFLSRSMAEISREWIPNFAHQFALGIDHRRSETALKDSQNSYRSMFARHRAALEAVADPVVVYDDQGLAVYVNPAFIRVFGWTGEELLGRRIDFVPEASRAETTAAIAEVYGNDEGYTTFESRRRTRDGRILDVSISAAIFRDGQGRPSGMVVNLKDLTQIKSAAAERRRLEAQFQQAQRMEAVGTLAGGIAHDVNNLLMGIQGQASLMMMDTPADHPFAERLRSIEGAVKSGAELTRQILGFARGGKYEVKPTDLNRFISTQNALFGRTKKEVDMVEDLQEDLWSVEVDRGQLEQILLNLYINAWQAMPGGGRIRVATRNRSLGADEAVALGLKPGDHVLTRISDNGSGMDEAIRQRIFEPFFTTKERGRGTGLGLASVYGIVENHGGAIGCRSTPGEGTEFEIYFPASSKSPEADSPAPDATRQGSETILLVDDEAPVLEVSRQILESLGYTVLVARSGSAALAFFAQDRGRVDLVILDMIMPQMGGGETFDRIRTLDPSVRVLLSSGYSIDGEATEILQRGCDGFLQKPFDIAILSRKIREILDRQK